MTADNDIVAEPRPGLMQQELDALVDELPRGLLERFLRDKLTEAGVHPKPQSVKAFAKHLLSGQTGPFECKDGPDVEITLQVTPEDEAKLSRMLDETLAAIPSVVADVTTRVSALAINQMRKRWAAEVRSQRRDEADFRRRLQKRWGKAFGGLRLLITLAREFGSETGATPRTAEETLLYDVVTKLHARGCQLANEALVLMENGFADGAMARWRTLYEVGVVATLIADWGPEAAQRYIAHEAVEAKLAIETYDECAHSMGRRPPSAEERANVKAVYDAVIAQYGDDFATGYGWAGAFLSNKRPNFRTLEDAADRSALRAYHKIASYNVHAGVKGITSPLGAMGDRALNLAGASNAGHGEPIERVARELVALTVLLYPGAMNLDELVRLHAMQQTVETTVEAASRAEWLLDRDERFLRAPVQLLLLARMPSWRDVRRFVRRWRRGELPPR